MSVDFSKSQSLVNIDITLIFLWKAIIILIYVLLCSPMETLYLAEFNGFDIVYQSQCITFLIAMLAIILVYI